MKKHEREKSTRLLREWRIYHKYVGVTLAALLLISALTGLALAWKKNVDLLQPPTQKGAAVTLQDWRPLAELATAGQEALQRERGLPELPPIDRLDVRPDKGIVKVLFADGWWEAQVDGATGQVLSVARRHSDWIEAVHDGSIISDTFKLVSMNALGAGLGLLAVTGLWLWYGPKRLRRAKRSRG